jgi:hypothetical protein
MAGKAGSVGSGKAFEYLIYLAIAATCAASSRPHDGAKKCGTWYHAAHRWMRKMRLSV